MCPVPCVFGFITDCGDEAVLPRTSLIMYSFTVSLFHWWKYEKWGVTLEEVGQLIYRTHHHIFHCYPLARSFSKWNPWRVCSGCLLGGKILMRWFEACMSSSAVSCPNPKPNSFRVRIYRSIVYAYHVTDWSYFTS